MLSIDTKRKEILGNFFHGGRAITDGRVRVQDHDFVTAEQRLVPYGVFDTLRNEDFMYPKPLSRRRIHHRLGQVGKCSTCDSPLRPK